MSTPEVDTLAKLIWNYHHMNHRLNKADCIFVLGSHDTRVAEYAADLFLKGYAPLVIFSGGRGRLTETSFSKTEAETFADIAIGRGVPQEKIIIENEASNTGENFTFTEKLLASRGLSPTSFIVVQKPYMERRTFATLKKLWPEKNCVVTSPPISFEDYLDSYPTDDILKDEIISIMVGDLQRIQLYADKGFQIRQEIPNDVWAAYERLVQLGYTKHLVDER